MEMWAAFLPLSAGSRNERTVARVAIKWMLDLRALTDDFALAESSAL